MHTLSQEVDQLLVQAMATGKYRDPDEALAVALRELIQRQVGFDPAIEAAEVVAGVRRGMDDAAAGRLRPASEFMAEFMPVSVSKTDA